MAWFSLKTATACLSIKAKLKKSMNQSFKETKTKVKGCKKKKEKEITSKLYLRKCTILMKDFSISLEFHRAPFAKVKSQPSLLL